MAAFRKARGAILVATTVIEVGVDVPHVAVIVVEDADRFGPSLSFGRHHKLAGIVQVG
jgi:ATP-dependent DNA helicase RecG